MTHVSFNSFLGSESSAASMGTGVFASAQLHSPCTVSIARLVSPAGQRELQMSKLLLILATVFALIVLNSGCTTKMSMTYYTTPAGASLYHNGQYLGTTPCVLYYWLGESYDRTRSVLPLDSVTLKWISGATVETGVIEADIRKNGINQRVTIERPAGVPGLQMDRQYAFEVLRDRYLSLEAECRALQVLRQDAIDRQPKTRTTTGTLRVPGYRSIEYQETTVEQ